jgi:hypothetical protein
LKRFCLKAWRGLPIQVGELLAPLVTDPDISIEVASFAAVALGLVFVASCHADSAEAILQVCPGQSLFASSPVRVQQGHRISWQPMGRCYNRMVLALAIKRNK